MRILEGLRPGDSLELHPYGVQAVQVSTPSRFVMSGPKGQFARSSEVALQLNGLFWQSVRLWN